MSYCEMCGRQIPDGEKLCQKCQLSQPQQEQPAGEKVKKAQTLPILVLALALVLVVAGFAVSLLFGATHPSRSDADALPVWQGSGGSVSDTGTGPDEITIAAPYADTLEYPPVVELPVEGEYILPGSDSVYIAEEVIASLTLEQLRLARNEIYARHGRIFSDETLMAYFSAKSWYQPLYDGATFDSWGDSILNEYEIANRDLIRAYEDLYAAMNSEEGA